MLRLCTRCAYLIIVRSLALLRIQSRCLLVHAFDSIRLPLLLHQVLIHLLCRSMVRVCPASTAVIRRPEPVYGDVTGLAIAYHWYPFSLLWQPLPFAAIVIFEHVVLGLFRVRYAVVAVEAVGICRKRDTVSRSHGRASQRKSRSGAISGASWSVLLRWCLRGFKIKVQSSMNTSRS